MNRLYLQKYKHVLCFISYIYSPKPTAANRYCSHSGKTYVQVVLSVGDCSDSTLYKKCNSPASLFWNQTFMFTVKQKCLLGKEAVEETELYPPATRLKVEIRTKREMK